MFFLNIIRLASIVWLSNTVLLKVETEKKVCQFHDQITYFCCCHCMSYLQNFLILSLCFVDFTKMCVELNLIVWVWHYFCFFSYRSESGHFSSHFSTFLIFCSNNWNSWKVFDFNKSLKLFLVIYQNDFDFSFWYFLDRKIIYKICVWVVCVVLNKIQQKEVIKDVISFQQIPLEMLNIFIWIQFCVYFQWF